MTTYNVRRTDGLFLITPSRESALAFAETASADGVPFGWEEYAEPTVVLTGKDALITHIEGLQGALTKRNATILKLTEERDNALSGAPTAPALAAAYRNGWQACAARFGAVSAEARRALETVATIGRRAHVDGYTESERLEVAS